MLRHLLVHIDKTEASGVRAEAALALTTRLGARLTGLYAVCDPDVPSVHSTNRYLFVERSAGKALATFAQHAGTAGVDVECLSDVGATDIQVCRAVVLRSREYDLVVLGQFLPRFADDGVPSDLLETTVVHSGRPVLVIPCSGHYPDIGRNVVVAWNGSREATRALHDALPLLKLAEQVTVLALVPDEAKGGVGIETQRITEHLLAHGVPARDARIPLQTSLGPVEQMRAFLVKEGADLLVMGAAGQQLGRGAVRRSLTGRILAQVQAPVMLSY